jgi:hypothetical protein
LTAFFLLLWLIVTVLLADLTDTIITKYKLSGLDEKLFRIFQWLFNGSTFIAVFSFLVIDICTIIMKTKHEITQTLRNR